MRLIINLDVMMAKRKMSLKELSEKVGISITNLSVLKNGHAKGYRRKTIKLLCRALECQPGDLFEFSMIGEDEDDEEDDV